MPNNNRFLLISLIFLTGAAIIGFQIIQQAKTYQSGKEEYTSKLHFEKRLLDFDEWFDGGGWEQKRRSIQAQAAALTLPRKNADYWSLAFLLLALVYLGISFRMKSEQQDNRQGTTAIIVTAISCLIIGLLAPMLEIAAFQKDLSIPLKIKTGFLSMNIDYTQNFPGEMYFYYQSKSVVELISLLFQQQNLVVGISILLFSVLIPLGKNSISLWGLYRKKLPESPILQWFLLRSGKWSMADVFVVAIFLGFLAFNNMQTGVQTDSKILTGLYFFLAYVLLAIWASVRVDKYAQTLVKPED